MNNFSNKIDEAIKASPGKQKEILQKTLDRIKKIKVNVLLIGGTGVGKSSTINALFHTSDLIIKTKATVGESANPETMNISQYDLGNVVIWDTPGLGDSAEKDQQHQAKIVDSLCRKDASGEPLIDIIFLVLDGASRDFSSAYKLIKEVVTPNLPDNDKKRLLIGINKADKVMHYKFWDHGINQPKSELIAELEKRSETVRRRIEQDTGFSPDVIYYAAGETHEGELIQAPYNLAKLLSFIIDHLPNKKRIAVAADINQNSGNFESNDGKENYKEKVEKSLTDSLVEILSDIFNEARRIAVEIINHSDIKSILITAGVGFIKSIFLKK